MSDAYYRTRLRYSGRSGLAMLHGKRVPLTDNPELLLGQRVFEMDYVPEIGCFQIRRKPSDPAHGDMTREEIEAADSLLKRLCGP